MPNDEPVSRGEVERLRNRLAELEAQHRDTVKLLSRVVQLVEELVTRQAEMVRRLGR